jgi:hypothetical protein
LTRAVGFDPRKEALIKSSTSSTNRPERERERERGCRMCPIATLFFFFLLSFSCKVSYYLVVAWGKSTCRVQLVVLHDCKAWIYYYYFGINETSWQPLSSFQKRERERERVLLLCLASTELFCPTSLFNIPSFLHNFPSHQTLSIPNNLIKLICTLWLCS